MLNFAEFDRVLPASAYQQQAGMPWWVWFLIIVVIIVLFVFIWRWAGLSKGGEQPVTPPVVEAKPVVAQPVAPAAPAMPPLAREEFTLMEKRSASSHAAISAPTQASTATAPQPNPEVVPGTPDKADDLALIEGIGPKIASVLQGVGIKTFAQLANTNVAVLEDTLKAAGMRLSDPASWPEQAKLAAEGKMDELKTLQDNLKGGRRA